MTEELVVSSLIAVVAFTTIGGRVNCLKQQQLAGVQEGFFLELPVCAR
jgi:hypothetical protein